MRMAFPWRDADLWILPGGGIKSGEDVEVAVVREVFEETDTTDIHIIGEAWQSESYIDSISIHLKQCYFLAQAKRFEPKPADLSEQEMSWVREYRWWSLESLMSSDIAVDPGRIGEGLQALILQGLPQNPIKIDAL